MRLPNKICRTKLIGFLVYIILVTSTLGCIRISISDTNNSSSIPDEQMISKLSEPKITFVTTGSSFSPIITVTGNPKIQWIFGDGSTSDSTSPTVNFSSNGTRANTLTVTPWSAVTKINVGYDRGDGGAAETVDLLPGQGVAAIYGLDNVAPFLKVFSCSNTGSGTDNTLSYLNLKNFTQLEFVECCFLSSLNQVDIDSLPKIKRLCFEQNGLNYLNLTGCGTLEDFRGASQHNVSSVNYVFGASSYPNLWHLCIVNNNICNNIDWQKFPAVSQLWMWSCANFTGDLNPSSTVLSELNAHYCQFTSANLYGTLPLANQSGVFVIYSNNFHSVNAFGNPGLAGLYIQDNKLNTTEIDNVLCAIDMTGKTGGTLDISSNTYPSRTGMYYHDNLTAKGWSITHDEPPTILADPNTTVPIANFKIDVLDITHHIIAFTDKSTNATAWQWNFGDGTANSTLQSPTHIYSTSGIHTITLTVSNAVGSNTLVQNTSKFVPVLI